MLIQEHQADSTLQIEAYRPGQLTVNGHTHSEAILIDTGHTLRPAGLAAPADLQAEHFDAALAAKPEIILIGTGPKQQFIHPRLTARAAAAGVGVECMSTEAACRTHMLLQSEGRRIWAWLWP